jgi:K+-transporting ATPase ATPase C chain
VSSLIQSARMLLALMLLTGVLYPLLVTVVGSVLFGARADGSLIVRNGKLVGSELIGQPFSGAGYFWSRPSATAPSYNAGASSGSNIGPLHPALPESVAARVAALRAADPSLSGPVAIDLVTASASGLDPHISVAAALVQAPRVARARGLQEDAVTALVQGAVEPRTLGLLGEPVVNVLRLNLALDSGGTK